MTDRIDKEIDRLFSQELVPLGARAKAGGIELLETRHDAGMPSYYVKRPRPSMAKEDFEIGGCVSPSTVARDLEALWKDDRDIGLVGLVPALARLAAALRDVEKESDDVSNFIYVMY